MKFTTVILGIVLYFMPSGLLSAQQKVFTLINKNTGEYVPFASLSLEQNKGIKNVLSDSRGQFHMEGSFPVIVHVICLGYKTLTDTLYNNSASTIELVPDVFKLDEVVVTGQVTPRKSDRSIYNVQVLTKKDIELKATENLSGLLSNELNIGLTQQGVLGRSVSIRGLSGEYIKILLNGMPVAGRQLGIIDLDQISLTNVDHIEIIEGPLSVIYGSSAIGGAINIITSQGTDEKVRADIGAHYETAGVYNANAKIFFALKNHHIGVYASRNFFAGFNPQKNTRFDLWKPKLQYIPGLTYSYRGKKFRSEVYAEYLYEELRDKDSLSSAYFYEGADDRYYYTKRLNSGLNLNYQFNKTSNLTFQTGYSFYTKIKNSYHVDLVNLEKSLISNPEFQDTTRFRLLSQRLSFTRKLKHVEILTGYDFNMENGEGKRIAGEQNIGDYAIYSSFIISPVKNIEFQPGLRLSYNTKYTAPLVYSFNLKYNLSNFRFRTSYAKGFRTPSLKELYMEFIDQNHHVYGNEYLSAETAYNYSISAEYIKTYGRHNLNFRLDMYLNNIRNKIDFLYNLDALGNLISAKYFNLSGEDYQSIGTSFISDLYFNQSFNFKAGISYTGISSLTGQHNYRFSPDIFFSPGYTVPRLFLDMTAYYKYTGKKYFYVNNKDISDASSITEEHTNGYHNLDINIRKHFPDQNISVTAGIKNVFNTITVFSDFSGSFHGVSGNGLPVGWGRTFFIKMTYTFRSKVK